MGDGGRVMCPSPAKTSHQGEEGQHGGVEGWEVFAIWIVNTVGKLVAGGKLCCVNALRPACVRSNLSAKSRIHPPLEPPRRAAPLPSTSPPHSSPWPTPWATP